MDVTRVKNPALKDLYQIVHYAIPYGVGGEFQEFRDRVAKVEVDLSTGERAFLKELEELALDLALLTPEKELWPGLLLDHPDKPLERWWWHLGKIRRGEYPLELLPDHLRRVVEEARRER